MHFLHINSEKDVGNIDKIIKKGNDVFILVYMKDCGPCNATRPEWEKLELALKDQYSKNNNIFVIDVNKDYLSSIKHIGTVDGFPTMKYISANGSIVETYESSAVKKKDRSVSSFINWIESKINSIVSTTPTSSVHNVYKRLSKTRKHNPKGKKTRYRKKQKGGKWSRKYKLSINCNKPKGFSQKQYCKYGRNK
jgi:hypothetical protein